MRGLKPWLISRQCAIWLIVDQELVSSYDAEKHERLPPRLTEQVRRDFRISFQSVCQEYILDDSQIASGGTTSTVSINETPSLPSTAQPDEDAACPSALQFSTNLKRQDENNA